MPKYREKPVEVEAFKFAVDDTPEWFLEKTKNSYCEFHYDSNGVRCILPTSEGSVMIIHAGDFVIKGVEGEIYPCESSIFEKTYDPVDLSKKARKMAELSGMLTKNGFNFTEKESEIDNNEMARGKLESLKRAFEEGRIKSSSVTNLPTKDNYGQWQFGESVYTFRVEPSAIAKEFVREVLFEKPVTMSLDGEEVGKACFKEVSKVMKRQDIEEVRPTAEEIDNYLRKNPSIKNQLIDLLKSRRGGFKK
ncbi:hypothetical protein [Bacillus licheniformis]|uniref:hypothetical protein n=1 Tax=Bacillus licheniformis TaxID=1402 RepID=UPI002DB597E1|nr:hypothetical protein [Bacillus licheniformis]MEC0475655.1 hypothetical protein [Bacillus licheniformis]